MAAIAAKVPTIATGTATSGISVARQFCRNSSTTRVTSATASQRVFTTSMIDSVMKGVVSYPIAYSRPAGNRVANSFIFRWMASEHSSAFVLGS